MDHRSDPVYQRVCYKNPGCQSGPYKYFKNPMYGLGQLQAYAMAIWYGSMYGLTAAFLNQVLIFTFYYLVEIRFINRVYIKGAA